MAAEVNREFPSVQMKTNEEDANRANEDEQIVRSESPRKFVKFMSEVFWKRTALAAISLQYFSVFSKSLDSGTDSCTKAA